MRAIYLAAAVGVGTVLGLSACDASIEEGCIGGTCLPADTEKVPGQGDQGATTSGGGGAGGGASGAGGAFECHIDQCTTDMPGPTDGILPCDVEQVLKDKCQRCHTEPQQNNAPFALLTYADTQEMYGMTVIFAHMERAIRTDFMPLNPPDLTPEEERTLARWLCACAPSAEEGTTCP